MANQDMILHPQTKRTASRLRQLYQSQLSAVIETERLMVELGLMAPEERRVYGREERRRQERPLPKNGGD